MQKHVKIIEWAIVNGRRVGPHDGVFAMSAEEADNLVASGQGIDVSADFADAEPVASGAAPIAAVPAKAAKKTADAPDPVVTPAANGIVDATKKEG